MIGLPAGTRIWIAAGVTDMRCGFQGLAAKVQTALQENPLAVTSSSSAVVGVTLSKFSGLPATGYACLPNGLNVAALSGRRPTAARST